MGRGRRGTWVWTPSRGSHRRCRDWAGGAGLRPGQSGLRASVHVQSAAQSSSDHGENA